MWHGKVIKYGKDDLPSRADLVGSDLDLLQRMESQQDISFYCIDVQINHSSTALLVGFDSTGNKLAVCVPFKSYFLVRIPDQLIKFHPLFEPDDTTKALVSQYRAILEGELRDAGFEFDSELTRGYHHTGFAYYEGFYVKIYPNVFRERDNMISHINKNKIRGVYWTTALDEYNNKYYRCLHRDYGINFAGWNTIKQYSRVYVLPKLYGEKSICNAKHIITVQPANICAIPDGDLPHEFERPRGVVCSWDIECYRAAGDGELPDATEPSDIMFLIGLTFGYYNTEGSIMRVCLTMFETNPLPGDLTIVCDTERDLCACFADLIGDMQPDFITGFNDGRFDYPYLGERAAKYGLLEYFRQRICTIYFPTYVPGTRSPSTQQLNARLLGTNHRNVEFGKKSAGGVRGQLLRTIPVKLDAETSTEVFLMGFFGMNPIDSCVMMRKICQNPEQYSLSYFLDLHNLPNKEDLKITELNETCRRAVAGNNDIVAMTRVKEYCLVDAESCNRLLYKRGVIPWIGGVVSMSGVTFEEGFQRADGCKVEALVINEAAARKIYYSTHHLPAEKKEYPGAYVVPPLAGPQVSKLRIDECREAYKAGCKYPLYTDATDYSAYANLTDADQQYLYDAVAESLPRIHDAMRNTSGNADNVQEAYVTAAALEAERYSGPCASAFAQFITTQTGRPISGVDFSSLYPSIIIAYNLSKENIIGEPNYHSRVVELENQVYNYITQIKEIRDSDDANSTENLQQLTHLMELVKLYKPQADQLRDKYNYESEYFTRALAELRARGEELHHIEFDIGAEHFSGYSIRHGQNTDRYALFPAVLRELFAKRKVLKAQLAPLTEQMEKWDVHIGEMLRNGDTDGVEQFKQSVGYAEAEFQRGALNSKQLAVKVFMNTFYGKAGQHISCLYELLVASGITSMGKFLIQTVIKFVKDSGFGIMYGDTDSAYVRCPELLYADADLQYYIGKIDKLTYWTRIVELTLPSIKQINDAINAHLVEVVGNDILKTAYEEVLWPVVLQAKKKYFGLPHEREINFDTSKVFIRGLEMKRRGISRMMYKVCDKLVKTSLDYKTLHSMRHLVELEIPILYNTEWDIDDCKERKPYKPNKSSTITAFVERMRVEQPHIKTIPGDRIEIVHVKRADFVNTTTGNTIKLKVSDMIEFPEVFMERGMELNIDYYVEKKILGQLARFMCYSLNNDFEDAKLYLRKCCEPYSSKYVNHHTVHKRMFREVNKRIAYTKEVAQASDIDKYISGKITQLTSEVTEAAIHMANTMFTDYKRTKNYSAFQREYIDKYRSNPSIVDKFIANYNSEIHTLSETIRGAVVKNNMYIDEIFTRIHDICYGIQSSEQVVQVYRDHLDMLNESFGEFTDADEMKELTEQLRYAIQRREVYKHLNTLYAGLNVKTPEYRVSDMVQAHMRRFDPDSVEI